MNTKPIRKEALVGILLVTALVGGAILFQAITACFRPTIIQPAAPVQIVRHYIEPGEGGHYMVVYRDGATEKALPFYPEAGREGFADAWAAIKDGHAYTIKIGYFHWMTGKSWPRISSIEATP